MQKRKKMHSSWETKSSTIFLKARGLTQHFLKQIWNCTFLSISVQCATAIASIDIFDWLTRHHFWISPQHNHLLKNCWSNLYIFMSCDSFQMLAGDGAGNSNVHCQLYTHNTHLSRLGKYTYITLTDYNISIVSN